MSLSPGPPGALRGRIDHADQTAVTGWAANADRPGEAVELELLLDGESLGSFRADRHRADLAAAGVGAGNHAFRVQILTGLSLHTDRVLVLRRLSDGAELDGSPVVLRREVLQGEAARRAIGDAVEAAAIGADPPALEALLRRLAQAVASVAPQPHHAALLDRWGNSVTAPAPPVRTRALVIDESIPDPGRDAGSSAILSHMHALRRLGFAVDFVPAYSLDASQAAAARLTGAGFQPWLAPWVGSVEEVLRRGGDTYAVVYVHRLAVMLKYGALIRRWCPAARLLYCVADLHHLRAERQRAVQGDDITAHDAGLNDLKATELAAIVAADATLTHSPYEHALLAELVPQANVYMVPWEITPPPPVAHPAARRRGVAFIGSYGHAPNLDAAWRLLDEVMPLVWAEQPGIPLLLAGSDMPADLRAAAARTGGKAEALGQVPALGPLWERTLLAAAPLRFGAGIKGKVLDSLAAGIPCLCSPIAAEGMEFPPALTDLVQKDDAAMARAILRLHGGPDAVDALARAGLAYISTRYAAHVIDAALRPALDMPDGPEPAP